MAYLLCRVGVVVALLSCTPRYGRSRLVVVRRRLGSLGSLGVCVTCAAVGFVVNVTDAAVVEFVACVDFGVNTSGVLGEVLGEVVGDKVNE